LLWLLSSLNTSVRVNNNVASNWAGRQSKLSAPRYVKCDMKARVSAATTCDAAWPHVCWARPTLYISIVSCGKQESYRDRESLIFWASVCMLHRLMKRAGTRAPACCLCANLPHSRTAAKRTVRLLYPFTSRKLHPDVMEYIFFYHYYFVQFKI
jgi:hypothetical protein